MMLARYRFLILFVTLLVFFAILSIVQQWEDGGPELPRFLGASLMVIAVTWVVVTIDRTTTGKAVTFALGFTAALGWVIKADEPVFAFQIGRQVLAGVFFANAMLRILGHLFAARRVTLDLIAASLCVYLLLGLLWAVLYSLVDTTHARAFIVPDRDGPTAMRIDLGRSVEVIYFSFATMTTLGYGDIVPKVPVARMLAALEALVGQLYLAVLVARLVGMHIVDSERDRNV